MTNSVQNPFRQRQPWKNQRPTFSTWTVSWIFDQTLKPLPIPYSYEIAGEKMLRGSWRDGILGATLGRHISRAGQGFDKYIMETSGTPIVLAFQLREGPF